MNSFGYDITPSVIQYNSSIRSKATVAQLLIEVSRFLLLSKPQSCSVLPVDIPVGKIRLIVYIDKMSRLFIEEHNKIHSFLFPLILKTDENGFVLSHNGYRLSNATCTILSAVFSEQEEDESIERIIEKYWDIATDLLIP